MKRKRHSLFEECRELSHKIHEAGQLISSQCINALEVIDAKNANTPRSSSQAHASMLKGSVRRIDGKFGLIVGQDH